MTKEIKGRDYVICAICKKKFKRITGRHLKTHNITTDEYKKKYPKSLMISDKSREATSISATGRINTPETIEQMRESANKRWEDENQRSDASKRMVKIANDLKWKERAAENATIQWKNPIIRQKMIDGVTESWNYLGRRELMAEIMTELQKDGGFATGHKHTLEAIEKIHDRFFGIPKTPEHCQHLSDNHWDTSMEKNPNWQGGRSFEKYPKDFRLVRSIILEIYNNCDYISGLPQIICNPYRSLSVHHIDYDKMNNDIYNLIPLSDRNHTITNYRRPFWERLFKYSLEYEEEYYSFDKAKIIWN